MSDLKKEIMSELIEEISNIEIGKILEELMKMEPEKVFLVKEYIGLLNRGLEFIRYERTVSKFRKYENCK